MALMDISNATEKEMMEARVEDMKSAEELSAYIDKLVSREHDYGTCVYAMSMAAEAAFNYVAGALGVTGFQASCADLDFIRRTRSMDCPFAIVNGEDMLYPQYNIHGDVSKMLKGWSEWAGKEAAKKIKENANSGVHHEVWNHWLKLRYNEIIFRKFELNDSKQTS